MKGRLILHKLQLITVEPILFLYMLVIFMESNALQELISVKTCMQIYHPVNISDCPKKNTTIVNEAAVWSKYYSCCLFFFTFFSTFYVGSWSDRLGRKFPMLIPPIGTVFASILNCFLSAFINTHIAYFFVSAVISGITFGTVGIIATTFGFISDFTHEQSRSKRIVILESMIFIGGTSGIYLAGVFLKHVDYSYKLNGFVQLFMLEGIISALLVIYIIFRIPSASFDTQLLDEPVSCLGLFSPKHIILSTKTVFRSREGTKRKKVLLMLFTLLLIYMGTTVQITLGYYYVKTLAWELYDYSIFHAIQFGLEGVALLIGLPALLYFFNVPDYAFAALGMLSRIAGFVMFGLSTNSIMVYSCDVLYLFSEFPVPSIRSMLSKTVNPDEKGRIFAFTATLQNLCFLVGSFIWLTIFHEFSFKGLCFEIAAGLQLMALLVILYLYFTRHEYATVYKIMEKEDGSVSEITSVVASNGSINQPED